MPNVFYIRHTYHYIPFSDYVMMTSGVIILLGFGIFFDSNTIARICHIFAESPHLSI